MRNIGDKVWWAKRKWTEKYTICPDCLGTLALTVIMGDGSSVSIDCAGCARGYEPPTGYVKHHEEVPCVELTTIQGMEVHIGKEIEYSVNGSCCVKESELFSTIEEAQKKAEELSIIFNREKLSELNRKEKPTRTWAWNACYHRKELKRAQQQLEYHSAKLSVAKSKSKEEEKP